MPTMAAAQDLASSRPSTQPAAAADVTGDELKPETIEARIRQVEAAAGMTQAARTELLSLYRQALDQVKIAATWAAEADRLEQQRQQIPNELAKLNRRIEQASSQHATQPATEVPPEATLDELNGRLQDAEAELKTRRQTLSASEDDIAAWSDRRASRPQKIADANTQLENVIGSLNDLPVAGVGGDVAAARRLLLLARQKALEQEIRTYEQELRGYDASGSDLLAARRDLARLDVARAEALAAAWREAVSRKREAVIDRQRQEAERQLAQAPEALRKAAETTRALADERKKVNGRINQTTTAAGEIESTLARVDGDFEVLQAKARAAGMAAYVGPLLRKQKARLPDISRIRRDIRAVNRDISTAQFRMVELEEQRGDLGDLEEQVHGLMEKIQASETRVDAAQIEPQARAILQSRAAAIDALQKDYETYWNEMVSLNIGQNRLLTKTQAVEDFINERVLWLPSSRPLFRSRLPDHLGPPSGTWPAIRDSVLVDVVNHPVGYGVMVLLAAAWIAAYPRVKRRRTAVDQRVTHVYTDSFGLTLQVLLIDLFLALPLPLVLGFLGTRMYWSISPDNPTAYDFALAIAEAARGMAFPLLILLFLLSLFRPGGLAEAHFQWSGRLTRVFRRNLVWLLLAGVPLVLLMRFAEARADENWDNSIGRAAYVAIAALLAVFAHRVLHPRSGVLVPADQAGTRRRMPVARIFWYVVGVTVPIVLLVASVLGYYSTARVLTQAIARSLYLVAGLMALRAVIIRAVVLSARRVAMRKAAEEHASCVEGSEHDKASSESVSSPPPHLVEELGEQSRALLRWLIGLGLVVGLWGIWQQIVPALGFMDQVRLWSYTVEAPVASAAGAAGTAVSQMSTTVVPVHLSDLLLALILAAATVILATNGPNMVEMLLLVRLPIDPGARFAIAAILRYIILVVGLVFAFGMIGIKWSQVQWLAAAITVGLGFGLQEIFANFVSGLILLFERPVRIGDTITVGDISGTVSRIQIRATTILAWDRKELIIPNRDFVTGKVINWTLSDSTLRIVIPVGIAYGSDTRLAERLLRKVAAEHPLVLRDPEPIIVFSAFGESSLDFELRVYVGRADQFIKVKHELHQAINDAFREAGIEIAFPQRDIHVRTISDMLQVDEKRPKLPDKPSPGAA